MAKKIILVDDSHTAREQVRQTLEGPDFHIVEAVDGDDGWEAIASHEDAALAIVDVNMPGRDGLSLVQALGRSGRLERLPVMMLTTETDPDLLERAKRFGAKAWMVKPFKPLMLLAAVRKLAGVP